MPLYMAPEILSGQQFYTKAVDVYSYGILCACVWRDGETPYAEYDFKNPLEMQNAVVQGCRPSLPAESGRTKEVIEACWSERASDRPTFSEVVAERASSPAG